MLLPHSAPYTMRAPARCACVEPRAGRLLTGHEDGSVVLRDGESCAPLRVFGPVGAPIVAVGWRSGAVLALDASAQLWWWSADTGKATRRVTLRRDDGDGARYEAVCGLIRPEREEVWCVEAPSPQARFQIAETMRLHTTGEGLLVHARSWQIEADRFLDVGRLLGIEACGDHLVTLGLNTYHGEWGEPMGTTGHLGVWDATGVLLASATVLDALRASRASGTLSVGAGPDGEVWCAGLGVERDVPWQREPFLWSWRPGEALREHDNPRDWHALASDARGRVWACVSDAALGLGFLPGAAVWEVALDGREGLLRVAPDGRRVFWIMPDQAQSFSTGLG